MVRAATDETGQIERERTLLRSTIAIAQAEDTNGQVTQSALQTLLNNRNTTTTVTQETSTTLKVTFSGSGRSYIIDMNVGLAYSVAFDANGGTGAPATQYATQGKATKISKAEPTRNGYEFLGWATSSTATTAEYLAGAKFTPSENSTLYAAWRQISSATTSSGTYLPSGFTEVAAATATSALTIQDGSGNQYVWVEVPRNETIYDDVGTDLDLDSLSGKALKTALDNIETELQEYAVDYRDPDNFADTYSSLEATGIADEDTYNDLKYTMLKSVYQNEGFYIGKYETGTATARNAKTDALTDAVIQANAYPYNYVTNAQAQTLASGMASGSHTSSLMFGIQWDLVLKYLKTNGATDEELKGTTTGSTNWGNYNNNPWDITNASAKYWQNSTDGWQDGVDIEKNNLTSILLSTGADSSFSKMGIYDLAGNVYEWTLEKYTSDSGIPCTSRGGPYNNHGSSVPASYRVSNRTSSAFRGCGFRVSLY